MVLVNVFLINLYNITFKLSNPPFLNKKNGI